MNVPGGAAAVCVAAALAGCGYHIAGKTDLLPQNIRTIAVPPFANLSTRYKLTDRMPAAIARELISRTRYRVIADPTQADAVLSGAIILYAAYPTVFDPATGRASAVQVNVRMSVDLKDRAGKTLFSRQNVEFHERYEISIDAATYFDESDAAVARLSREVARSVVSAVLENF